MAASKAVRVHRTAAAMLKGNADVGEVSDAIPVNNSVPWYVLKPPKCNPTTSPITAPTVRRLQSRVGSMGEFSLTHLSVGLARGERF